MSLKLDDSFMSKLQTHKNISLNFWINNYLYELWPTFLNACTKNKIILNKKVSQNHNEIMWWNPYFYIVSSSGVIYRKRSGTSSALPSLSLLKLNELFIWFHLQHSGFARVNEFFFPNNAVLILVYLFRQSPDKQIRLTTVL